MFLKYGVVIFHLSDAGAGDSQDTPSKERPFQAAEETMIVPMDTHKQGSIKSDKGGRKLYFVRPGRLQQLTKTKAFCVD